MSCREGWVQNRTLACPLSVKSSRRKVCRAEVVHRIGLGLDRRYIELWQRHPIRKGSVEDNAAAAGRSILPTEQDPARDYKVRVDLTHLGLHPVIAILVQQIIGRPFYRDHFNHIKTTTDTVLFDCYIFFRDDPDIGRF